MPVDGRKAAIGKTIRAARKAWRAPATIFARATTASGAGARTLSSSSSASISRIRFIPTLKIPTNRIDWARTPGRSVVENLCPPASPPTLMPMAGNK